MLAAAAEKAGWDSRPSPKKNGSAAADVVTGRGVGLGVRNGTYVATIAEVEVNRKTGVVRVKRFVCAHDCGLIINPDGLRGVIGANLMQSMSRALKEEVKFDRSQVTSVDWVTYPVCESFGRSGTGGHCADQSSRSAGGRGGRAFEPSDGRSDR